MDVGRSSKASMIIKERKVGTYIVLDLTGRLTINEDIEQIPAALVRLLESGVRQIALDLKQATYMDSTGSASLIQCYQKARQAGVKIKFLDPSPRIKKLFEISKLDTILDIDHESNLQTEIR